MHRIPCRWLLPVAAALAMSAAQAQVPPPAAAPPDPLDAAAGVPPLVHRSTLSSFRRLGDDKPVPWREANETVGRIGGWRAYAREAAGSAAPVGADRPASAAPTPDPASAMPRKPMPAGHGGHSMH